MTTPITTTLRALTANTEILLSARLRPLGVTVPQLEFLAVFAADPDASGADAARACSVTPQTGTTILRGLTGRGLIKSTHVVGAGRRFTVTVTTAGHELLVEALAAVKDVEQTLEALLGSEAALLMRDAIGVLRAQVAESRPKRTPQPRPVPKAMPAKKSAKKSPKKPAKKPVAMKTARKPKPLYR